MSMFFPTKEVSVIYIRFRSDIAFSRARARIEKVRRNYVPESLALDIEPLDVKKSTTQGIRDMMGDISLLLAITSMSLVVLSMYSAISMGTASRQKEVTIRKINGATPKMITFMFGRVYIIRLISAYMITCLLLQLLIIDMTKSSSISSISGFAWGIYLFTVISLPIFITTACEIYRVMYLNPADIIENG